jgi:hypothetical protein
LGVLKCSSRGSEIDFVHGMREAAFLGFECTFLVIKSDAWYPLRGPLGVESGHSLKPIREVGSNA